MAYSKYRQFFQGIPLQKEVKNEGNGIKRRLLFIFFFKREKVVMWKSEAESSKTIILKK